MKFQITSFFLLRRRIVKGFLKFKGWHLRGQDHPSQFPKILFVSPAKGDLIMKQLMWMPYLTAKPSEWAELGNMETINILLLQKHTVLIRWDENQNKSLLTELLKSARNQGVRISACAWLSKRQVIKFHSQFRPSFYTDRDIRYLNRFFKFYRQI